MPVTRYRCNSCGNLTRFDVTSTRRTRAFHHYSVGGDLDLEDVEVLSEVVEDVSCRWCGSGQAVVEIDPDESGQPEPEPEPAQAEAGPVAERGAGGPG
jgi:hypothetical protein